jgi:predicted outer membrane protein
MKTRHLAALATLATIGAASVYATAQNATRPAGPFVPPGDLQFMMKAAGGGIAEFELAKLAIEKAASPEVKKHA